MITKFPRLAARKDVADFLLRTYPITEIAETCAQLLMNQTDKIPISRQQFAEHFRIIGEKEDGTAETRGRKPISRITPIGE